MGSGGGDGALMTERSPQSPATSLARGDPGDETGRRYRYQYQYTASLACALLTDTEEAVEVFCEHHEDVLVKYRSGTFAGIQVKTRQLGSEPWRATDADVLAALAKFVRTDTQFSQHFEKFILATNHQFFLGKKNGKNLSHLLELACSLDGALPTGILGTFVTKIATASGCSAADVIRTLKKTSCDHDLPKFRDSVSSLCEHIRSSCDLCTDAPYPELQRAADSLTDEIAQAATLEHEQALPLYMALRSDTLQHLETARIDGKRVTRDRVLDVLQRALRESPVLLVPADDASPTPLPDLNSKLARKLNAGGLSATSIHAARDCWSSALKRQLDWNSKLGEERALQQHRHLKALVLNEAAAAHEATITTAAASGRAMLEELRRRLRERRTLGDAALFGSLDEHLLGYAYMLTEECKVWWSQPFDIEESG